MKTTKPKTMMNYIKIYSIIAFTVLTTFGAKAQTSQISFFHLGDYVQQTTDISPVYIPKSNFSFGLPGIGVAVGNGYAYSDLYTEIPGTNKVQENYKNLYNSISGDYNNFQESLTVNILNLAFKRDKGSISFFMNLKSRTNWEMSKNGFINLLGNGITAGSNIVLDDKINAMAYTETGIGFTQQFLNDKLAVGIRVKYLMGIANTKTEDDALASINVDNDLNWILNTNNAVTKIAGIPLGDDEDFEFSTANSGFGFDIGATYEIIPNLVVEAAINDIGSITWKDNIKEYYLEDASNVVVKGADLEGDGDVFDNLLDEIEEDIPSGERTGKSYKTSLATSSYLSASYLLNDKHQFRATMFNNHSLEDSEATLALGYNIALKKTTYGVVGIKNSDGDFDFGLNIATKLGPLQFYAVTDNLNKILGPVQDIKQVNLRLGLNLVFGDID